MASQRLLLLIKYLDYSMTFVNKIYLCFYSLHVVIKRKFQVYFYYLYNLCKYREELLQTSIWGHVTTQV